MFKNHPKGLFAAALANMGERFGFYTMMAILVLFLQAKFGLDGKSAGIIYSVFYALIYVLALAGGFIADMTRNYKGTILVGLFVMAGGYLLLSIPTPTPVSNVTMALAFSCLALFMIAFGNGLFKGNLQALVGQMYDNEKYSKMRDSGFSLFYMFINVGAMFAPLVAPALRNWWLKSHGFIYDAGLPSLCHQVLDKSKEMSADAIGKFSELSSAVSLQGQTMSLTAEQFAADYLNVFTTGFHYAFGVAIVAMLISVVIYIVNKKGFPDPKDKVKATAGTHGSEMSVQEVRQRVWALFAVYGVVIFFWFSFHQNGLTLTFFARDYTNLTLFGIPIAVEHFQSVNPFLVVFLTPVIMGLYGWLRAKNMEPSTPKKIAIGMGIAAVAFTLMAVVSKISDLPLHSEIVGRSNVLVTPWLLIGTYFILTVAELFISPLGISFVSKVAPPHLQGLMQGGWLTATAIGNQFLFIGAIFYESIPIWATWTIFVTACLISMFTMLFMLKWLERVAK
ncbi:MAG: peptide MFS transporter [Dysgonamonadaceae bacterium]|jgi:POT family proton-dependent oligopeptide transporter|nr:peptide MFS transporter [Dysgonamonadaceae bacterium]